MNDANKRKAGRPRTAKVYHSKGALAENPERAALSLNRAMDGLKLAPTHKEELAIIFDELILGQASDKMKTFCGLILADMVATAPSDTLEEFFKRIVAMKKRLEEGPQVGFGRMYHALEAFQDYVAKNGFKPSKPKLKKFILENPHKYKGMPGVGDGKGWSDLWEDAGLQDMRPR